jgi:OHCU decarboxylase
MASERPFTSVEDLIAGADRIWWSLKSGDWLEAFCGHPKIGEKRSAAPTSIESQNWSSQEQASISDATQDIMRLLADLNRHYEKKFGYIYIVCATGKNAEEMLEILRERLNNDPEEEIRVAAAEQARITTLRLKRLLEP